MHTLRIILFLAIIIGSGWFFYSTYSNQNPSNQNSAQNQDTYKKSLPFFTIEEKIEHKQQLSRVAKIQQPHLYIDSNPTAAEKINMYIERMIDDERIAFFERINITPGIQASSSTPQLGTLSIQFEELYTHPQLISIALHVSKSFPDSSSNDTYYAMFDATYGTQLPVQKLFTLTQEAEIAQLLCQNISTQEYSPTHDECVRTIQNPDAIGINAQYLYMSLLTGTSTLRTHITIRSIHESLHPNIRLALQEHQESIRMSTPE